MPDRTKLLIHLRRISNVLDSAIRFGPDGTLDGKFSAEHPIFVHHACAFYLIGCLAYLESEAGRYSWNSPSQSHTDFDTFANQYPPPPKASFASRGISAASMQALADIRNAVAHLGGDLSQLDRAKKANVVSEVKSAAIPGVALTGSVITLEPDFLEFTRVAALAVRNYHGEF